MKVLTSFLVLTFMALNVNAMGGRVNGSVASQNQTTLENISEKACINYHDYRTSQRDLAYPKYSNSNMGANMQDVKTSERKYIIDRQQIRSRTMKDERTIDNVVHKHTHPYFSESNNKAKTKIVNDKLGQKVATELKGGE